MTYNESFSDITVVTCYFNIKSKFPSQTYKTWMKNFLEIPMNLVVFTDMESSGMINYFRKHHVNTKIIISKLEDFYMYKYFDYFIYSNTIDPEKNIHYPELYLIWAEKTWFVDKAIKLNCFNTSWFFWCDIGCIRATDISKHYINFPQFNVLPDPSKIIYSRVGQFHENDIHKSDDGVLQMYRDIHDVTKLTRIQGGFFAVHVSMIKKLTELYEQNFCSFMKNKLFAGKDQYIMYNMYVNNPDVFFIINGDDTKNKYINDIWFTFLNRYS